jgi:hypothetical protein
MASSARFWSVTDASGKVRPATGEQCGHDIGGWQGSYSLHRKAVNRSSRRGAASYWHNTHLIYGRQGWSKVIPTTLQRRTNAVQKSPDTKPCRPRRLQLWKYNANRTACGTGGTTSTDFHRMPPSRRVCRNWPEPVQKQLPRLEPMLPSWSPELQRHICSQQFVIV